MSAITEVVNRILDRNGHDRLQPLKMNDPIFSELLSIVDAQDTISDSELTDLHTLVLDDHICGLIWEDSYPLSDTNERDHDKDIGSMEITAIFHRFRPPEEAIIAKKDSPDPYARLFCIWMCTYEAVTGTDYDALAELLFDDISGVGNQALEGLGDVVSSHQVLYQAIKEYLDPEIESSRNPETVRWIFQVLDEIKDVTYNWEPRGTVEETDYEATGSSLYDTDMHIIGGENWVRAIVLLQEDKEWLARVKRSFDRNSSNPYKCISDSCDNHFWIQSFVYSRDCTKCRFRHCDECLNDERVCKTCENKDVKSEE